MLGFISGKVISIQRESLQATVLCGAVGYEVFLARNLIDGLEKDQSLSLWIHTLAREDALVLYGFASEREKAFFRTLLSVSGLGPKSVLSLLSEHGVDTLAQLILSKNEKAISSAPGIGKKTAQRIVLELRSKVEKWEWASHLEKPKTKVGEVADTPKTQLLREDLSSALENLGYPGPSIRHTLDRLLSDPLDEKRTFEQLLKLALGELTTLRLSKASTPKEVNL